MESALDLVKTVSRVIAFILLSKDKSFYWKQRNSKEGFAEEKHRKNKEVGKENKNSF